MISVEDNEDDLELDDPPDTEDWMGFSCCIAAGFSSEKGNYYSILDHRKYFVLYLGGAGMCGHPSSSDKPS